MEGERLEAGTPGRRLVHKGDRGLNGGNRMKQSDNRFQELQLLPFDNDREESRMPGEPAMPPLKPGAGGCLEKAKE